MVAKCSAKQIADFVALWGMTGTFPEYCEFAEDARRLKSLDLIISTTDVFVDAFCFSFEDIYRKYNVNFPLSEEKFIEFLKPRCLLLTKDNKCFNFVLVCAFVYDIIHSFSHYNKCFHLVKVASKCLAAILRNRFKKIFETDSDWEELMSFCIKIHSLVYPPEKIHESDGNQFFGVLTDNMDALLLNTAHRFAELPVEKYATDDNFIADSDSDSKMIGKKTSTPLKKDLTTESEELEGLSNSEFPSRSGATLTLQFKSEGLLLKSENIVSEKSSWENSEKDCVAYPSLPDLANEFADMVSIKMIISNIKELTEKLGHIIGFNKNFTLSLEDTIAIKKVIERLDNLCNLRSPSTGAPHSRLLKVEDKEKMYEENHTRKNNEKDCAGDMTDSSISELAKEFTDRVSEKTAINNKENNEKLDQMSGFNKNLTLSFEDYSAMKKVIERLEDLCNLRLPSTGASYALQLKREDSSPKKEKTYNENDGKKDDEDCVRGMTHSLVPNLTQEITMTTIKNKDFGTENLGQMNDIRKHLTLSFKKDIDIKKAPENIDLCNLEPASSKGASHTFKIKGEDFFPNSESEDKEKVVSEINTKGGNKNELDSFLPDVADKLTKISIEKKVINKIVKSAEKAGQMIGCRKNLTLNFGNDSSVQNGRKKLMDLGNLESASSTDVPWLQLKDKEISPKNELKDNEEPFNIRCMSTDKIRTRITDNPQYLSEIMKLLKKCEENIDTNIFSPDEYVMVIKDSVEDELEASGGILESSINSDKEIFVLSIKELVFAQNMKMADSFRRIFREDNPSDRSPNKDSGGESMHEMSDEVAYASCIRMLESGDLRCSLCTGGMIDFFDAWANNFARKYSNNDHVSDLFTFDFHEDSE